MSDCDHDFDSNEYSNYCAKGCGETWAIFTIKQLNKRLSEAEKELEQVRASHKRQCDLNDKAWERVREMEKDYQDALEVVKYYASEDTWISKKFDKDGNLDEWMPKKPNDVSIFPYSIGTSNGNFHCLGKRARDFLERVK